MRTDKFTIKSQEAIQKAQDLAQAKGNQQVDAEHLLYVLLEEGIDRQSLPVFAHRTEQTFQVGSEIDPTQVADEQTQPGTTRDGVFGDLDVMDGRLR